MSDPISLETVFMRRESGRRGIASTIYYYGVAHDREGKLEAHVWLLADGVNVVGGERAKNFRLLKTFPETADKAPRNGFGLAATS